jgi:hypothetical protein
VFLVIIPDLVELDSRQLRLQLRLTLLPSYMFAVSEIESHCGIEAWTTNSHVVHAVSETAGGVYQRLQPVAEVWPVFSHEPNIARAPAPTNEYVVYAATSGFPGRAERA